jgi:type IV secretion/conjugal transfer VirB4 family ATPase
MTAPTSHAALIKSYRRASEALNGLVNLCGFLDDHVFLTKSGDLGIVLALEGVDVACLDAGQREALTRRFEIALRVLDDSMRLSQYVLKQRLGIPPDAPVGEPRVDALLAARHRCLEARQTSIYTLTLYAVLLAESEADGWSARIRDAIAAPWTSLRHPRPHLSVGRSMALVDHTLERRRRRLWRTVDAFTAQLHDVLQPRVVEKWEAFSFVRQLLNYDRDKATAVHLSRDTFVDYDVADSMLECHRTHLRLDDYYVRVLTLKEPPRQTCPHLWQSLYDIPSELILMNDWQREADGPIRREIHAKRRHFHNSKISLTNYLPLTAVPPAVGDVLVDDSATAMVKDLGACLTELTVNGRYFGRYTLTVVLYDTDPAALDRSVAACIKAAAAQDAQLTDERANLLNAWLAVLPGNTAYNFRAMHLLNTNGADLSFLAQPHAGDGWNVHLDRESLALVETSQGTLFDLNLHVNDVGHTLVLGATGSGKSFWLNFLVAHLQKYAPRTLIFDLGGGFDTLTQYFGGRTLRLGLERHDVTINPFSLRPTATNLQFLCSFVKVLIESGGQYAMTGADEQDLSEQIDALYALEPEWRRLGTLAGILRRPLAQQLQRWVDGGPDAWLFDHAVDGVSLAGFQSIDFAGLGESPHLLEPLLFYLLHRADADLTASREAASVADTLTLLVVDEAWRFLTNPTIRAYVTEALKTWRKKNACVLLATQSSEDLARSEMLRVAIESCPTKCFLANPYLDRAMYQELFHLNDTEAEHIATLVPRRQLLLKRPDYSTVLNLVVDPDSARLFAGRVTSAPAPDVV